MRKIFVTTRVVAVKMRVDHETDVTRVDRFNSPVDAIRQGRKLIIDDHGSIRPDQYANVTTGTCEEIKVIREFMRNDFNRVEVLLCPGEGANEYAKNNQ